ncbi:MAG TPA: hypothetical protein VF395_14810 [Polyangiaceae bacterium]
MNEILLRRTACIAFVGACALGVARAARAADRDPAAAEALFREGRKLSDGGDHRGACEKFKESFRLDPTIGTTFNIADCEERLGNLAEAWSLFGEVAQRLPAGDRRKTIAGERQTALEPRLSRLRIVLEPGAPSGARVARDGVSLGTASLGTDLPVNPGGHVVVVEADGRSPRRYPVTLAEGQQQTLMVTAGAESETKTETHGISEAPAEPRHDGKTLGYVLGGVGIAGVVTGIVAGTLMLHQKSVLDDNCNADRKCNPAGLDAASAGHTLGIVTTVGLVTGALGLGGGAYFLFTAAPARDGTSTATAALIGRF